MTFDLGLKTCGLFSSYQVILGPCDPKFHSLPEETVRLRHEMSHQVKVFWWWRKRQFGPSVVSIPAETDQFNTPVNLTVAPDIWNKMAERGWRKQVACIYYSLKLFTSAYYKTWNVKRPRVNSVFLKCGGTLVLLLFSHFCTDLRGFHSCMLHGG